MSPLTMGLLALLAYKAMKGGGIFGTSNSQTQTPAGSAQNPHQGVGADWLTGLGSLISGGAGSSILTGGLGELMKRFQQTSQGRVAQTWVDTGPNDAISPTELEKAVGEDTLDALSRQTGIPRDQLLTQLAEQLPQTVDKLTPQGRLPSEHEATRWM
jgi:uncharacterized protein YidB (DUF937 family)